MTAALFSHHHCCLLAGISTFLSPPCCCLSLGLGIQGEIRVATPKDRILVPGWRLLELKERAHQVLAVWCWPQSPFKGIQVLEDSLAQNGARSHAQCSRSLSFVATFLGLPSAGKASSLSLENFQGHFLSPEALSFPASACSASGVVLLASAGSCARTDSMPQFSA